MPNLHHDPSVVESDRTFRLRMALEDSQELDRIVGTYPVDDDTADFPDPTAMPNGDPVGPADDRPAPDEDTGDFPPVGPDDLPEPPEMGVARYVAVELPAIAGGATDDGMAFPEQEYSLADRKRWLRQSNLAETWYGDAVE